MAHCCCCCCLISAFDLRLKVGRARSRKKATIRQLFERSSAQRVGDAPLLVTNRRERFGPLKAPALSAGSSHDVARSVAQGPRSGGACQEQMVLVTFAETKGTRSSGAEAVAGDPGPVIAAAFPSKGSASNSGRATTPSKCKASARKRAGYFCFGKSNQNHLLPTLAGAARRFPALLAKRGSSPKLAALKQLATLRPLLAPVLGSLQVARQRRRQLQLQGQGQGSGHCSHCYSTVKSAKP